MDDTTDPEVLQEYTDDSSSSEGDSDDETDLDSESEEEIEENNTSGDEAGSCPICLNRFVGQDLGSPDCCSHTFCFECILEWSKNINTCPVDRTEFNFIYVKEKPDGPVLKKVKVKVRQREPEELLPEDTTECEICHLGDREHRLLLCDGCDLAYHCDCLDPPLFSVPIEEWFCPSCASVLQNNATARPSARGTRRIIARTGISEAVRSRVQNLRKSRMGGIARECSMSSKERTPKRPTKRKRRTHRRRSIKTIVKLARTKQNVLDAGKGKGCERTLATIVTYRRRKRKRKLRKAKASTKSRKSKQRLSNQFASSKNNIDKQNSGANKSGSASRTSFALFGVKDRLMDFSEDFNDEDAHASTTNSMSSASSTRCESSASSSINILDSIMAGQEFLHSKSKNVIIQKDGSLVEAKEQNKVKSYSKSASIVRNSPTPCIKKREHVSGDSNKHLKPVVLKVVKSEQNRTKSSYNHSASSSKSHSHESQNVFDESCVDNSIASSSCEKKHIKRGSNTSSMRSSDSLGSHKAQGVKLKVKSDFHSSQSSDSFRSKHSKDVPREFASCSPMIPKAKNVENNTSKMLSSRYGGSSSYFEKSDSDGTLSSSKKSTTSKSFIGCDISKLPHKKHKCKKIDNAKPSEESNGKYAKQKTFYDQLKNIKHTSNDEASNVKIDKKFRIKNIKTEDYYSNKMIRKSEGVASSNSYKKYEQNSLTQDVAATNECSHSSVENNKLSNIQHNFSSKSLFQKDATVLNCGNKKHQNEYEDTDAFSSDIDVGTGLNDSAIRKSHNSDIREECNIKYRNSDNFGSDEDISTLSNFSQKIIKQENCERINLGSNQSHLIHSKTFSSNTSSKTVESQKGDNSYLLLSKLSASIQQKGTHSNTKECKKNEVSMNVEEQLLSNQHLKLVQQIGGLKKEFKIEDFGEKKGLPLTQLISYVAHSDIVDANNSDPDVKALPLTQLKLDGQSGAMDLNKMCSNEDFPPTQVMKHDSQSNEFNPGKLHSDEKVLPPTQIHSDEMGSSKLCCDVEDFPLMELMNLDSQALEDDFKMLCSDEDFPSTQLINFDSQTIEAEFKKLCSDDGLPSTQLITIEPEFKKLCSDDDDLPSTQLIRQDTHSGDAISKQPMSVSNEDFALTQFKLHGSHSNESSSKNPSSDDFPATQLISLDSQTIEVEFKKLCSDDDFASSHLIWQDTHSGDVISKPLHTSKMSISNEDKHFGMHNIHSNKLLSKSYPGDEDFPATQLINHDSQLFEADFKKPNPPIQPMHYDSHSSKSVTKKLNGREVDSDKTSSADLFRLQFVKHSLPECATQTKSLSDDFLPTDLNNFSDDNDFPPAQFIEYYSNLNKEASNTCSGNDFPPTQFIRADSNLNKAASDIYSDDDLPPTQLIRADSNLVKVASNMYSDEDLPPTQFIKPNSNIDKTSSSNSYSDGNFPPTQVIRCDSNLVKAASNKSFSDNLPPTQLMPYSNLDKVASSICFDDDVDFPPTQHIRPDSNLDRAASNTGCDDDLPSTQFIRPGSDLDRLPSNMFSDDDLPPTQFITLDSNPDRAPSNTSSDDDLPPTQFIRPVSNLDRAPSNTSSDDDLPPTQFIRPGFNLDRASSNKSCPDLLPTQFIRPNSKLDRATLNMCADNDLPPTQLIRADSYFDKKASNNSCSDDFPPTQFIKPDSYLDRAASNMYSDDDLPPTQVIWSDSNLDKEASNKSCSDEDDLPSTQFKKPNFKLARAVSSQSICSDDNFPLPQFMRSNPNIVKVSSNKLCPDDDPPMQFMRPDSNLDKAASSISSNDDLPPTELINVQSDAPNLSIFLPIQPFKHDSHLSRVATNDLPNTQLSVSDAQDLGLYHPKKVLSHTYVDSGNKKYIKSNVTNWANQKPELKISNLCEELEIPSTYFANESMNNSIIEEINMHHPVAIKHQVENKCLHKNEISNQNNIKHDEFQCSKFSASVKEENLPLNNGRDFWPTQSPELCFKIPITKQLQSKNKNELSCTKENHSDVFKALHIKEELPYDDLPPTQAFQNLESLKTDSNDQQSFIKDQVSSILQDVKAKTDKAELLQNTIEADCTQLSHENDEEQKINNMYKNIKKIVENLTSDILQNALSEKEISHPVNDIAELSDSHVTNDETFTSTDSLCDTDNKEKLYSNDKLTCEGSESNHKNDSCKTDKVAAKTEDLPSETEPFSNNMNVSSNSTKTNNAKNIGLHRNLPQVISILPAKEQPLIKPVRRKTFSFEDVSPQEHDEHMSQFQSPQPNKTPLEFTNPLKMNSDVDSDLAQSFKTKVSSTTLKPTDESQASCSKMISEATSSGLEQSPTASSKSKHKLHNKCSKINEQNSDVKTNNGSHHKDKSCITSLKETKYHKNPKTKTNTKDIKSKQVTISFDKKITLDSSDNQNTRMAVNNASFKVNMEKDKYSQKSKHKCESDTGDSCQNKKSRHSSKCDERNNHTNESYTSTFGETKSHKNSKEEEIKTGTSTNLLDDENETSSYSRLLLYASSKKNVGKDDYSKKSKHQSKIDKDHGYEHKANKHSFQDDDYTNFSQDKFSQNTKHKSKSDKENSGSKTSHSFHVDDNSHFSQDKHSQKDKYKSKYNKEDDCGHKTDKHPFHTGDQSNFPQHKHSHKSKHKSDKDDYECVTDKCSLHDDNTHTSQDEHSHKCKHKGKLDREDYQSKNKKQPFHNDDRKGKDSQKSRHKKHSHDKSKDKSSKKMKRVDYSDEYDEDHSVKKIKLEPIGKNKSKAHKSEDHSAKKRKLERKNENNSEASKTEGTLIDAQKTKNSKDTHRPPSFVETEAATNKNYKQKEKTSQNYAHTANTAKFNSYDKHKSPMDRSTLNPTPLQDIKQEILSEDEGNELPNSYNEAGNAKCEITNVKNEDENKDYLHIMYNMLKEELATFEIVENNDEESTAQKDGEQQCSFIKTEVPSEDSNSCTSFAENNIHFPSSNNIQVPIQVKQEFDETNSVKEKESYETVIDLSSYSSKILETENDIKNRKILDNSATTFSDFPSESNSSIQVMGNISEQGSDCLSKETDKSTNKEQFSENLANSSVKRKAVDSSENNIECGNKETTKSSDQGNVDNKRAHAGDGDKLSNQIERITDRHCLKWKIEIHVKAVLKPFYVGGLISKDDYKDIMRRAVPKILANCRNYLDPEKIKKLVISYITSLK